MNNFWKSLQRPIKMLAPMAGYTDAVFRLLCREFGADVVVTELISADAIAYGKYSVHPTSLKLRGAGSTHYTVDGKTLKFNKVTSAKNQPTCDLLSFFEAERPLVVQLFGKYPEKFALATKWISQNLKVDGIDINMGCPARKVVGSDHGAALIKYPKLAIEIVQAVKKNTDLPVSVKTRLGWDDPDTILKFAPVLYKAGIDAIIIHGRTYKQGFRGEADWTNIYKLKEMLPDLVVIGNGGIKSITGVISTLAEGEVGEILNDQNQKNFRISDFDFRISSLDGYAIGTASFGKPWIFSGRDLDNSLLKRLIFRHAELVFAAKGEYGLIEFRKHLLKYLSGFDGAKELRQEAVNIQSLQDIRLILEKV